MNEITFLNKTLRNGICSECVADCTAQNHELMPIHTTILEVREVMLNLEANMLEVLRERTTLMTENKNKLEIIKKD